MVIIALSVAYNQYICGYFRKKYLTTYRMQGKGLIKLFLVLLILVTVMQFLYMLPTQRVEADAEAYAMSFSESEQKIAKSRYLDSMSSEVIFSIPLLKKYTYADLKKSQLALGLDLKGGYSAVMQVNVRKLLYELSGRNPDANFIKALDNAVIAQSGAQSDFVSLFQDEYAKLNTGVKLSRIFLKNPALREEINTETTDGEVIRLLNTKVKETVKNTFDRLKQRVDKIGVAQPNITLDAGRDLILAELPGIDNAKRAEEFLQANAALEFWDVYQAEDPGVRGYFQEADRRLKAAAGISTERVMMQDTSYSYQYDTLGNVIDSTMSITDRVDPLGNQGPLLSILNMGRTGGAILGTVAKSDTAELNKILRNPELKALFPANSKLLLSDKPTQDENKNFTDLYQLYMIKTIPGTDKAPLEGDIIKSAGQNTNPTTGQVEVSLSMKPEGAKVWADMTTRAAPQRRSVAIVLDNEVISAPSVNGPIIGGNTAISGNFSVQEAVVLSKMLEVGKLPAELSIIQSSSIGPSLGAKNIKTSLWSMIVGFLLVLLFMIVYYGGAGIVSIIALFANMLFIFGALASFGTVLTLPGFAGIILTIGMAVDANVIIYERVREELRAGKSTIASIADGFKNSYSAIIDANVTTLLVAGILAYYGLGPIKGFAVVLIIGVLSSLFTAVLLSRLTLEWWTSKDRDISFWTGFSKNAFANLNIDWLGKRKIAYVVSGVILLAGVISMFTRGFDLGVDFRGGYSYTIEFAEPTDAQSLRDGLTKYFKTTPVVKAVSTDNTYQIVTEFMVDQNTKEASGIVLGELYKGIKEVTSTTVSAEQFALPDSKNVTHIISSSKVGPTIADDIKRSSLYAGIFALLLIFLYIFIRFNKWQYSLGAVAALFHDSLIVLSIFSIFWGVLPFSMEIDQAFIAAILTVIGYSINDTVVVFDRIREDLGIYTNKSKDEVINGAINSTFSRTIITSLTTLLMVTILAVFGGGSIKGFAFALVVGILVGTYSSIFVATPIVRDLSDKLRTATATKKSKRSFSRASSTTDAE